MPAASGTAPGARAAGLVCAGALLLVGCADATTEASQPAGPSRTSATETAQTESGAPSKRTAGTAPSDQATDAGTNRLPTVPPGESEEVAPGIVVSADALKNVSITGAGPGELSGPGISVTVHVDNDTDAEVDLGGFAVNAYYGKVPAIPSLGSSADQLAGELAPGGSASGVYLFVKPDGSTGALRLEIEHSGATDVVVVKP